MKPENIITVIQHEVNLDFKTKVKLYKITQNERKSNNYSQNTGSLMSVENSKNKPLKNTGIDNTKVLIHASDQIVCIQTQLTIGTLFFRGIPK